MGQRQDFDAKAPHFLHGRTSGSDDEDADFVLSDTTIDVLGPLPLLRRSPNVPREAQRLKTDNEESAWVDLPPTVSIDRRTRKRVMIVVPRKPQRRQGQQSVVTTFVFRRIGPRAEPVANRVDAPYNVVHNKNAY